MKLQEAPKQQKTQSQFLGYSYDAPSQNLHQRPPSSNDLVSSAASPTAIYTYNAIPQNSQSDQQQNTNSFPCNRIPWLPMFPSDNESNRLRAKLQGNHPMNLQSEPVYQNREEIDRPQSTQILNAHTYLPPRNQRPLRRPSIAIINQINSLPLQSTSQPFRNESEAETIYQTPHRTTSPVETTPYLPPISIPNLSFTPIPPLYGPKPFLANTIPGSHFVFHSSGLNI